MNLSKTIFAAIACAFVGGANATDITIFYAPTCPHCHHAREFISSTLIYEYNDLKVTEVNVLNSDNTQNFVDALYKCGYKSGGVPVMVVGEKCFQGYADATQGELRTAVEVGMTDAQKSAAVANRTEMANNKDAFVAAHPDRKNAITEHVAAKKN